MNLSNLPISGPDDVTAILSSESCSSSTPAKSSADSEAFSFLLLVKTFLVEFDCGSNFRLPPCVTQALESSQPRAVAESLVFSNSALRAVVEQFVLPQWEQSLS